MKTFTVLTFAVIFGLAASAFANPSVIDPDAATDIHNPIYANLGFPADHEVVDIKPISDDTVLEEGAEREVESSDVGKPELVPDEKPVTHTLDSVNLPESELDPSSVKIPDEMAKESEPVANDAVPVAARWKKTCPAKCTLYLKHCPYGCRIKYCYIRVLVTLKVKRAIIIKVPVKVARHIRVRVKICRDTHYDYFKRHCIYKYKTKIIYVTVFKYKKIYKVHYITKYKYKRGIRCHSYNYH